MKVWVAIYEHKYGNDTCVFDSESKARQWKDEVARAWWFKEFPDNDMPDVDPGDAYFDLMLDGGEEYFLIKECEVQ